MKIDKTNASPLSETDTDALENPASQERGRFVSVRRLWQWWQYVRTLAWTFSQKITFAKGLNVGNALPTDNGDIGSNGTGLFVQLAGTTRQVLTSANGLIGRTLFVSTLGNDATASPANLLFPYRNPQTAIGQAADGDTVVIFGGTYTGNLTVTNKSITILCVGKTVIHGNVTFDTLTSYRNYSNAFLGEDTTVNGYFEGKTVQQNRIKIRVREVNAGANRAFTDVTYYKTVWDVADVTVTARYLLTGVDANTGVSVFDNVTFQGESVTGTEYFTGVTLRRSVVTITDIFGTLRFDSPNMRGRIEDTRIVLTGTPYAVFEGSYQGFPNFEMLRVKVVGTTTVFCRGLVTRYASLMIQQSDFTQYLATEGLVQVFDAQNIAAWHLSIAQTYIHPSQRIYARASLRPTTKAQERLDVYDALGRRGVGESHERFWVGEDFVRTPTGNLQRIADNGGGIQYDAPQARLACSMLRIDTSPNARAILHTPAHFVPLTNVWGGEAEIAFAGGQVDNAQDRVWQAWGFFDSLDPLPTNGIYFRPPLVGESASLKCVVRAAGVETVLDSLLPYDTAARRFVKGTIVWNGADIVFYSANESNQYTNSIVNFLALYPAFSALALSFGVVHARVGNTANPAARDVIVDKLAYLIEPVL